MSALSALLTLRKRRPGWTALAGLTLAILVAWPVVDWWLRGIGVAPGFEFWDFGAHGAAVDRWQAGEPLYLQNDEGGFHGSYLYPPVSVLLFYPFTALFDPVTTRHVWSLVTVGLLWVGTTVLVESLGRSLSWPERGVLLVALAGFQPLLLSVKMGQTAAFTGGLLCLAGAGVARDRADEPRRGAWATLSGAATAVVGFLKLPYAPAGAHLLADRRRFLAAAGAGLALLAASLAVFGVDSHRLYLEVLAWGVGKGGSARTPALWLPPYYRPLSWLPASTLLRFVGSAIVAGYAVLGRDADREVFALGVASITLLAPLAYTYYFVALLPAVVVLLAVEFDHPAGHPAVPLVALLCLQFHSYGLKLIVDVLPGYLPLFADLRPAYPLFQPGLWGNALLVGLAAVRVAERVALPAALDARLAAIRVGENETDAD